MDPESVNDEIVIEVEYKDRENNTHKLNKSIKFPTQHTNAK